MKSNNALLVMGLLLLVLAITSSATIWADVAFPVKIAMLAFGFGMGVVVGTLIARRAK